MLKLNEEKSTGLNGLLKVNDLLDQFGVDTETLTIGQAIDIAIDIKKVIEKHIKEINKTK
jgi:hypothetical protein